MKYDFYKEGAMEKTAAPKKVKKKTNFGMLSVKAGIDNNPQPTKADRIAGASMSKKAATALTKTILKQLKGGKGIKATAKKLKVDPDLVTETARKSIQSKTTAKAITKEKNKGMLSKLMDSAAGRKPVKELKAHAKASGGESKRVVKNMLGKKQVFGQRGSFKNLPKPTPKVPEVKAEIVKTPHADKHIAKIKSRWTEVKKPSILDKAKKLLKGKAGILAGGAAGGAGGYAMGKNANAKKD